MKKAQSEVITTVLIILLVLAAVFIVYTAVKGMVTKGTTSAEEKTGCIGLDLTVASYTKGTAAHCSDGSASLQTPCLAISGNTWIPQVDATVTVTRGAGGAVDAVTPVILVAETVATSSCADVAESTSVTCTLTGRLLTAGQKITAAGKFGTTSCDISDAVGKTVA